MGNRSSIKLVVTVEILTHFGHVTFVTVKAGFLGQVGRTIQSLLPPFKNKLDLSD